VPRIAGRGPITLRLRIPVPAQLVVALLIYVVAFILGWTYPLVRHPEMLQIGQNTVDPNFYIWSLRWWPYALAHGHNPLITHQIGAPAGYNLAWATTVPTAAVLLAPITAAFGPITSFNLLMALAPPLTAWTAFIATRRLTRKFWAALLAGAVYGFSSYEITHTAAGHANLTLNMLLPLAVYLVLLWRDGKLHRAVFVALMAITLALEFYTYLEAFAEMSVILALALLLGFALAGRQNRQAMARLTGLFAVAYALAIVAASPYLLFALKHYPKKLVRSPQLFSLNLANLVIPRPGTPLVAGSLDRYAEVSRASLAAYVGIPLLVLVLALAIFSWRERLARFLVIMFVLVVALAVGPYVAVGGTRLATLPWSKLWSLPVARSAEPYRLILLGLLVLAFAMAVWLATPARKWWLSASRWLLGLLAVAVVLVDMPAAVHAKVQPYYSLPPFISSGAYKHYLKPGEIVSVVSERGNAAMVFQADTNFYMRVAGGFINASLTPHLGQPAALANLMHPTPAIEAQFRQFVQASGMRAILVEAGGWPVPPWTDVFRHMGLTGTLVGGVYIYQIPACWAQGCKTISS